MRVYIRKHSGRAYYAGWDQWSNDYRRAISFETVPSALHKIAEEHLRGVDVVLLERSTGLQLTFPGQTSTQMTVDGGGGVRHRT